MRKPCTTPLAGTGGACTIIPVRPERSGAKNSAHPERSGAKSKDALFVLATLLMVLALAGCGGNNKATTAPLMQTPIAELPGGHTLMEGTIPAGESQVFPNADGTRTVVTCPANGPDCIISLAEDGTPQYAGGMPTIATYTAIEGLPDGHTLMEGTIPAGETRVVHDDDADGMRTEVTCPADGPDCVVTFTEDGAPQYTGGAPTVTTYTTLYLPSGHTLAERTTIPAGESREFPNSDGTRRTVLICPFDGEACVVTLTEDGTVQSTGGTPTVTTYTTLSLPNDHGLTEGTTIPAGGSLEFPNADGTSTGLNCPEGGGPCVVSLTEDGTVESTGGTPTVVVYTDIDGLPSGHTLTAGTIPAGETRTVHTTAATRTDVTCPADGEDCVVILTGGGTAQYTGVALTIATYNIIEGLHSGHTLTASTTIPAGMSEYIGYRNL